MEWNETLREMVSRDDILTALSRVIDPEIRKPVTELDMVRAIEIDGGDVTVTIALTIAGCPLRNSFQEQVAREVGGVPGVATVKLEFGVMTPDERAALTTRLRGGRSEEERTIQLDPRTRVIAVASGKGGVGKSSLTVNLAAALSALGRKVGVLDADVYGHSIPHMLGIQQKPVLVDQMMIPPVKHDLKLMSIGFFLDDNQPVMWRGPMLHKALEQFLQDVHWGELDVLVVDMPPGTGDVSISLAQLLPRAEAVVVTTPQLLAQEVAVRAASMAREDRHARARRGREHDLRGLRLGRRRAARRRAWSAAARLGAARHPPARSRRLGRAARALGSGLRGLAGDLRDRAVHSTPAVAVASRARSRSSASEARRGSPASRGARVRRRGRRGARRAFPRRRGARPCGTRPRPDRMARDLG